MQTKLKKRISKILKDDLVIHTAIVFLGTTLVGVCNLIYRLLSVRLLTPQDYGTFNALISLIMFSSMAISPLGTTLPRFFTEYITKKNFDVLIFVFLKLIKRLILAAFVVFFIFITMSSYLAEFLKTKVLYVIVCGGIVSFSLFSLLFPPLFQSFQKFKTYSFIAFLSSLGKLLIGATLMYIGWGVLGGLSGFLSSHIIILLISLLFIGSIFRQNKKEIDNQKLSSQKYLLPIYKYFFPVSLVMFSFTILTTIDVLLVKHFFSPLQAGYYAIAQIVGMIALFLPSALAVVILPKGTEAYVSNSQPKKLLYKSLFLGGICCFTFTLGVFIFPELVLKVLTGKLNSVSLQLTGLFSLAMSFYALSWIVVNFLLSTHNLKFVLPLFLAALLEATAIYLYHNSLVMVLWILLGFSMATFLVNLFIASQIKPYKA